jgi:cellulose synthase (UDP-forming)
MPKLIDPRVALVQTPQYYANTGGNRLAAAAWAQQALFFGVIARGKAALGAMMCCGTNSLFRRQALTQVGYFPEGSLTEDFALSVRLHAAGWKTAYVPKVLASGLGPEDAASYVIQHQRWARGCLAGVIPTLRARLPISIRLQYLLSSMFFLSGWTFAIYLALPAVRIFTGAQPLSGATANQFLLHFAPYYGLCLATLAVAGAGAYTFAAFSVLISNYWVHIASTLLVLARRKGRFVVTPKKGSSRAQPGPVVPALVALGGLLAAVGYGIGGSRSPATLNNVAFASMHVVILLSGVAPALLPPAPEDRPAPRSDPARPPGPAVRRRVDVAV